MQPASVSTLRNLAILETVGAYGPCILKDNNLNRKRQNGC